MFWLVLIALFLVIPVLAGSIIHAGSGRTADAPRSPVLKARRPRIATTSQHTLSTTHAVMPVPANAAAKNR